MEDCLTLQLLFTVSILLYSSLILAKPERWKRHQYVSCRDICKSQNVRELVPKISRKTHGSQPGATAALLAPPALTASGLRGSLVQVLKKEGYLSCFKKLTTNHLIIIFSSVLEELSFSFSCMISLSIWITASVSLNKIKFRVRNHYIFFRFVFIPE